MIQFIFYSMELKPHETIVLTLKRNLKRDIKHNTTTFIDLETVKYEIRLVCGQIHKGKALETALIAGIQEEV
jgi:molybdenum cofactor biosynthesis enzyme